MAEDTEIIKKSSLKDKITGQFNIESQIFGVSVRAWLATILISTVALHVIITDLIAAFNGSMPPKLDVEVVMLMTVVVQYYFQKSSATSESKAVDPKQV